MKLRVGILRGGPSPAYDESLKTGSHLLSLLRDSEEYEPVDIFISKDGEWHHGGLAADPYKILGKTDLVWSALHGGYGESGEVQRLLESLHLPFVGSEAVPTTFSHHKHLAKELYLKHGIPTPAHAVFEAGATPTQLVAAFRTLLHPVVVKPATGVRGVGVRLAHTFEELKNAIQATFHYAPKVVVEEFVSGTVATVGVVEGARGERLYALVPAHLETHYRRVRPKLEENRKMEELAKKAHEVLGLRHYSASDFVITPRGKIYMLETNAQPLFYEDSLLHRSLESSGWQSNEFVEHCLKLALGK